MFKKLCVSLFLSLLIMSGFLAAEIEYDIKDIGTLQTRESHAIAINNQGQILGWYNIDGSNNGKHFFVRDRDESFHEITEDFSIIYENIPQDLLNVRIDWRFLTDEGVAYGTFTLPNANPVLFMWNQYNGIVKLGNLPGKEIITINNAGQVLIKSIVENENGKSIRRPVIWQNGKITKLHGLEGGLGIESEESFGFDMNNNGDVVGQSVVYLIYKNNFYKEVHATLWKNGQVIDLHNKVTKRSETSATAINDLGDVIIEGFLLHEDGSLVNIGLGSDVKTTDTNYLYTSGNRERDEVCDRFAKTITTLGAISYRIHNDVDSLWMKCVNIVNVNDNGEIVVQGKTIYGEEHIMFLSPAKSN